MEAGNEVGNLAKGLFGDYVEVTAYDGDKPDLSEMIACTQIEMDKGTPILCEASFSYNGLYCAVDILKKEDAGWAIYEVKSSAKHKKATGLMTTIKRSISQISPTSGMFLNIAVLM